MQSAEIWWGIAHPHLPRVSQRALSQPLCCVRGCLSLQRGISYQPRLLCPVSMSRKAVPARCAPPHQHNWQRPLCSSQVIERVIRPKILHTCSFFLRENASAEQQRWSCKYWDFVWVENLSSTSHWVFLVLQRRPGLFRRLEEGSSKKDCLGKCRACNLIHPLHSQYCANIH